MPVSMSELIVGERYSRNELAEMWGYQGRQPISRGVVTPAGQNLIILFVTQEKQAGMTDYQDRLEGQVLHWEADGNPRNVLRVTRNLRIREDEIHLFFRDTRREDFIYCGELNVVSADPTTTYGTFVLALDPDSAEKVDAARPEERPTPPVAREGAPRPTSVLATFVEAPAPRPVDRPATAHSAEAVDAPSPHDRTAWGWAGTATTLGAAPSFDRSRACRSLPTAESRGADLVALHGMGEQRGSCTPRNEETPGHASRPVPRLRIRAAARARPSSRPRRLGRTTRRRCRVQGLRRTASRAR